MSKLEWGDELSVPFDSTVVFGHGYDFNCLDSSLTAAGPNGNYRMWSRSGVRDGKYVTLYSLYRDSDGAQDRLVFEGEIRALTGHDSILTPDTHTRT